MLLQYFVEECNHQLAAELESRQEELARMRVPERVRMAVRMRLEMLMPYIGMSSTHKTSINVCHHQVFCRGPQLFSLQQHASSTRCLFHLALTFEMSIQV